MLVKETIKQSMQQCFTPHPTHSEFPVMLADSNNSDSDVRFGKGDIKKLLDFRNQGLPHEEDVNKAWRGLISQIQMWLGGDSWRKEETWQVISF
jgi:hypothetical protein